MSLPVEIPQLDDEPEAWTRFVEKAAKGSPKATEMLVRAEFAVVSRCSGERLHETQREPDYVAFSKMLQLSAPSSGPLARRHPPDFYDFLWKRGASVDSNDLIHDALVQCRANWSMEEYVRLKARLDDSYLDYNSQDVVAAMILLLNVVA